MKIVITEGSGFLDSHVADTLSKSGHQVTIFNAKKSKNYFLKLYCSNKRE